MMVSTSLLIKPEMRVLDVGCSIATDAITNGCKWVMVINPPTAKLEKMKMRNLVSHRKIIPKCAYSKPRGYVNPVTNDFVRYGHLIPSEYRNKEVVDLEYYCDDYYFRCVTIDNMVKYGVEFMNIDYLEYDVVLGGKNIICRYLPQILVKNNVERIKELLELWDLNYITTVRGVPANKTLFIPVTLK